MGRGWCSWHELAPKPPARQHQFCGSCKAADSLRRHLVLSPGKCHNGFMTLAPLFGMGVPQASPISFGEPTVWTAVLFIVLLVGLAGITSLFCIGFLKPKLDRRAA